MLLYFSLALTGLSLEVTELLVVNGDLRFVDAFFNKSRLTYFCLVVLVGCTKASGVLGVYRSLFKCLDGLSLVNFGLQYQRVGVNVWADILNWANLGFEVMHERNAHNFPLDLLRTALYQVLYLLPRLLIDTDVPRRSIERHQSTIGHPEARTANTQKTHSTAILVVHLAR